VAVDTDSARPPRWGGSCREPYDTTDGARGARDDGARSGKTVDDGALEVEGAREPETEPDTEDAIEFAGARRWGGSVLLGTSLTLMALDTKHSPSRPWRSLSTMPLFSCRISAPKPDSSGASPRISSMETCPDSRAGGTTSGSTLIAQAVQRKHSFINLVRLDCPHLSV
jgi:hypothetical protein